MALPTRRFCRVALFPEIAIDYRSDIRLLAASR
jgi:hypothetical protein